MKLAIARIYLTIFVLSCLFSALCLFLAVSSIRATHESRREFEAHMANVAENPPKIEKPQRGSTDELTYPIVSKSLKTLREASQCYGKVRDKGYWNYDECPPVREYLRESSGVYHLEYSYGELFILLFGASLPLWLQLWKWWLFWVFNIRKSDLKPAKPTS